MSVTTKRKKPLLTKRDKYKPIRLFLPFCLGHYDLKAIEYTTGTVPTLEEARRFLLRMLRADLDSMCADMDDNTPTPRAGAAS